ncbi:hypothetical protein BTZ20_2911 [Rhodococcus sp. MTM3W5.2]|nr:hypothetical protein BTZ20_2911 [Rhodococcus sp. MTM3W5.2]
MLVVAGFGVVAVLRFGDSVRSTTPAERFTYRYECLPPLVVRADR